MESAVVKCDWEDMSILEGTISVYLESIRSILQEDDQQLVEELVEMPSFVTDSSRHCDAVYPRYERGLCYYKEFWKTYVLNELLISKIKEYSVGNRQLRKDVAELDAAEKQWTALWTQRVKKKVRRTADAIQKTFRCPFEKCQRTYGSDVSLNLHMKLKHNSGTKTQRETLAKEICLAEEKGQTVEITLTFPPGYLESFRQSFTSGLS